MRFYLALSVQFIEKLVVLNTAAVKFVHSDLLKKMSVSAPEISWTVHPMRENPAKGILFWFILAFVVWMVYWNIKPSFSNAQSVFFTFFAALILLLSLTSFYLPTLFEINERGILIKRLFYSKRFKWEKVNSIKEERTGLFISPFAVRSRLENHRGLFLYFRSNRDQVIEAVRHYKPELFEKLNDNEK